MVTRRTFGAADCVRTTGEPTEHTKHTKLTKNIRAKSFRGSRMYRVFRVFVCFVAVTGAPIHSAGSATPANSVAPPTPRAAPGSRAPVATGGRIHRRGRDAPTPA